MSALDQERWNSGGIVLFAFFFFPSPLLDIFAFFKVDFFGPATHPVIFGI